MNEAIFNFLFSLTHRSPFFDSLTVFIAQDLIWLWVAILIFIAVLSLRRHHFTFEAMAFVLIATIASWSVSEFLKMVFATKRPFMDLPVGSTLLSYVNGSDAFPSSHATFLFALAVALYFYNRTLGTISLVIAVLVSLARVATGLHWPVDILGGLTLALVVTLLLRYWTLKTLRPRSFR